MGTCVHYKALHSLARGIHTLIKSKCDWLEDPSPKKQCDHMTHEYDSCFDVLVDSANVGRGQPRGCVIPMWINVAQNLDNALPAGLG